MSPTKVGVVEVEGGWSFACGCGATGTPTPDREVAREAFKTHRLTCPTTASAPKAEKPVAPATKPQPTTKAPGGPTKMTTGKQGAARKGAAKATRQRAVNEKEALSVIEKIKADKSTVMAEARRLGCYHATLRKALRAAIGEAAYAKLMGGKRATKKAPKKAKAKKTSTRKRASAPAAAEGAPQA